jgi:hypothetical protein
MDMVSVYPEVLKISPLSQIRTECALSVRRRYHYRFLLVALLHIFLLLCTTSCVQQPEISPFEKRPPVLYSYTERLERICRSGKSRQRVLFRSDAAPTGARSLRRLSLTHDSRWAATCSYPNGLYEGVWKNGKKHGQGQTNNFPIFQSLGQSCGIVIHRYPCTVGYSSTACW